MAFVDDDLEQPKDQGVELAAEPETMTVGGHDLAFVVDPDGYRVDLVERGTMKVGTDPVYAAPLSLLLVSSTSMPERRSRFSPRILRFACSVSCG